MASLLLFHALFLVFWCTCSHSLSSCALILPVASGAGEFTCSFPAGLSWLLLLLSAPAVPPAVPAAHVAVQVTIPDAV